MTARRLAPALALVASWAWLLPPAGAVEPSPEVVARLDGRPILRSDIEPRVAFQLFKLEADIHRLLQREVEELIDRRLLEREAAARGISVDELLESEVRAKVPPLEPGAVDDYLAEHPESAAQGAAVRERVATYLAERRYLEKRLEYLDALRREARIELLLPAPEPPRTELDLTGAPIRGPSVAAVTVVHFGGFNCVRCAKMVDKLRELTAQHPDEIRWVHRHFFAMFDELALASAELAMAAQDAGRFWDFHDELFDLGGRITAADLEGLARQLGLAPPPPPAEAGGALEERYLLRVKEELAMARRLGVNQAPLLFVNGRFFSGSFPASRLEALVLEELQRTRQQRERAAS